MPVYAVTGNITFGSRNQRDRAVTRLQQEATTRGFTTPNPTPYPDDYPAGPVTVGTVGLRFCYTHNDEVAVDEALTALNEYFAANGRADGLFGSQYVSD